LPTFQITPAAVARFCLCVSDPFISTSNWWWFAIVKPRGGIVFKDAND